MKKAVLLIVAICFYSIGISQEKKLSSDKLLKELAENGCKCVDSILTYNRSKAEIVDEINTCIDKQTSAYQLGSQLAKIDMTTREATKEKLNISVNTNENSDEYKKYYYELERYMMDNCKSLKIKIASNEKQAKKSFSENPKAREFYYSGLKEFEKGKYEKAIKSFEKALNEDADFAFAWDNIGLSYRKLNDYDKAIEAYNKSLELDPKGAMPLQNIAIAYQYKKEYQKAIDSFQKLAEIDKNNPEIYFGMGNVYTVNLKDYEKGLDNMCKAYNMYVEQKSAYRADAEKLINHIHSEMKAQGKEAIFSEILKVNNISE